MHKSLLFKQLPAGALGIESDPHKLLTGERGLRKETSPDPVRLPSFQFKLMNSRFYYPTNSGSLGESRRPNTFMSLIEHERSTQFASDENAVLSSHGISKPSVLVVEDNDDSLFILRNVLLKKGYRVLEAWDGKQAVEMAETADLDLILLDLQLPRLNGLGVIHRLRQNSNLQNMPIVVITGHDPETHRGSAIAAGCDDFLLKPIDFDRLDAILDYYAPVQAVS